ncbi:hypothetical protein SAMN05216588_106163 [Pseudomonas flavescens]|uniref:2,4-dihydroxyhept-2-ene-1,7-dioic acid aldolase n=1 Tax=Phytopseudomonas flavescens TaxID=29435 RepID=A0A1G8ECZ9_9GAMM|nr:DUF2218 domain-containing protein [Pseudomonas flavescens]SDH67640.1 hypothetical protein SAMN05216588_106163 [Pseudomonas flavescens]
MIRFQGCVATAAASLYMTKLCKHFRHKIAVEFDAREARAEFPYGVCLMSADERALSFECLAQDDEAVARMCAVVDDHLVRFARKEALRIEWRAVPQENA